MFSKIPFSYHGLKPPRTPLQIQFFGKIEIVGEFVSGSLPIVQCERMSRARPELGSSIMRLWTPDRDYNISDNTHMNTLTMEQMGLLLPSLCKLTDI